MKCLLCEKEIKFNVFSIFDAYFSYCSKCFNKFNLIEELEMIEVNNTNIKIVRLFEYNDFAKEYLKRIVNQKDIIIVNIFKKHFELFLKKYILAEYKIFIVNDFLDFQINNILKMDNIKEINSFELDKNAYNNNNLICYFGHIKSKHYPTVAMSLENKNQGKNIEVVSLF